MSDDDQLRTFLTAQSRIRGMMLGLALGDTMGGLGGGPPGDGSAAPAGHVLRSGVSTQLACFTAEGIVRAWVRGSHKGICHPPSVVLHAYCRWAALQGIEVEKMRRRWAAGAATWPDGWLAHVPALAERRGSAPATVTALSRVDLGEDRMATASRGSHAVTRTLPVAAFGPAGVGLAADIAALTHGDPQAGASAAYAAWMVYHCLIDAPSPGGSVFAGRPVLHALHAGTSRLPSAQAHTGGAAVGAARHAHDGAADDAPGADADPGADPVGKTLRAVFRRAVDEPGRADHLARYAPDATAPAALRGALYAAASFPDREQVGAALEFASRAADGAAVACVTGALLGAAHGADALPPDVVSRHELAWVLDTLARDLQIEFTDSPGGSEYVTGWDDPNWWQRYPGW